MKISKRIAKDFFIRDVLDVAPDLIGKYLTIRSTEGIPERFMITETEAYRGEDDKACHASKGRTQRTEIMYNSGGHLYVYLIYGMYWMLNIVTGEIDNPQAVLIRGVEKNTGPGVLTRNLGIDKSFNGLDVAVSGKIWIEDDGIVCETGTSPRIGIGYSGEYWSSRPWRFFRKE